MTPDVLMARPAGRDPADMVNVFVPLPPATTIGVLGYVVPVEAAASAPGVVVNVIGGFSVTATLLVLVGSLTLATVMVEVVAERDDGRGVDGGRRIACDRTRTHRATTCPTH